MMTAPSRPIYLDYASTTPVHPRVRQAMEPYFQQEFGNPSSLSPLGRRAAEGCERARAQIARVLACHDDEVVFTSGGSASDNVALRASRWPGQAGGISSRRQSSTARCWARPATFRSTSASR